MISTLPANSESLNLRFYPAKLGRDDLRLIAAMTLDALDRPKVYGLAFWRWIESLVEQELRRREVNADAAAPIEPSRPKLPNNWSGSDFSEALVVATSLARHFTRDVREFFVRVQDRMVVHVSALLKLLSAG